jgi:TPR repeat protein
LTSFALRLIQAMLPGYLATESALSSVGNLISQVLLILTDVCDARENAEAQVPFGRCLRKAIGVPKNLKSAAEYHRLSVLQPHAPGQTEQELDCLYGRECPLDLNASARFLKLAADQAQAKWQRKCALVLYCGYGAEKDSVIGAAGPSGCAISVPSLLEQRDRPL